LTKTKKQEIVTDLTAEFKKAEAIIVCDYKTHTVAQLETLRGLALENGVTVQVAKNSLSAIALKNAGKDGLKYLNMNIFIWGEDQINTAKTVSNFAQTSKKFIVNAAYIDGKVSDAATVEAFAKLPNREELLGMLASVWMAPVRNFAVGLDQLRQQKEEA
jgi:large subunit ribosomal protein L10